jgi:tetratricopeptide (TPR) repeat protein
MMIRSRSLVPRLQRLVVVPTQIDIPTVLLVNESKREHRSRYFSEIAAATHGVREHQLSPKEKFHQRVREEEKRFEALEAAIKDKLAYYEELKNTNADCRDALMDLSATYEALMYWDEALKVEEQLEEYLVKSDSYYRRACLYMSQGDLRLSRRFYELALAEYASDTTIILSPEIGQILVGLAGVHYYQGRLDESTELLEKAYPHFIMDDTTTPVTVHENIVKCLDMQGLLYRKMFEYENALMKYEMALSFLEQLQRLSHSKEPEEAAHERRQHLQLHIADMLAALERYDEACELYERIQREHETFVGETCKESLLQGVVLHNLGRIHAQTPHLRDRAKAELTRALELKEQFGGEDSADLITTLHTLGALCAVTNEKRHALEYFQRALLLARMHEPHGRSSSADIMLALRNIAILQGDKVEKWDE